MCKMLDSLSKQGECESYLKGCGAHQPHGTCGCEPPQLARNKYDEDNICDHGLVLLRDTGSSGRYRRVGIFRAYHKLGQKLFEKPPLATTITIE